MKRVLRWFRKQYVCWQYFKACHRLAEQFRLFERVLIPYKKLENGKLVHGGYLNAIIIETYFEGTKLIGIDVFVTEKLSEGYAQHIELYESEVLRTEPLDLTGKMVNAQYRFKQHKKLWLEQDLDEPIFSKVASLSTIHKTV